MNVAAKVETEDLKLKEPIIRDFMAIERTMMANERTLLSYIRTALGFFIGGASFIEFFDNVPMQLMGWVFIPSGLIAFGLGLYSGSQAELGNPGGCKAWLCSDFGLVNEKLVVSG